MDPIRNRQLLLTRRQLFGRAAAGIGTAGLASLLNPTLFGASSKSLAHPALPGFPNLAPKGTRVIYLHQSGAPSQMDLFDPKPRLADHFAGQLPDSIRGGPRLTGMTSDQKSLP